MPKDFNSRARVGRDPVVERHAKSKKGPETKKAEKSRENIKKPSFTWNFTQNWVINCKKAHDAISEEKVRRLPYFR